MKKGTASHVAPEKLTVKQAATKTHYNLHDNAKCVQQSARLAESRPFACTN